MYGEGLEGLGASGLVDRSLEIFERLFIRGLLRVGHKALSLNCNLADLH